MVRLTAGGPGGGPSARCPALAERQRGLDFRRGLFLIFISFASIHPLLATIHLKPFLFLPPLRVDQILALHGELRYYEELAGKKSVFDGDELQAALGDALAVGGGYVLEEGQGGLDWCGEAPLLQRSSPSSQ